MRSRFAPRSFAHALGALAAALLLPPGAGADDTAPQISIDHKGFRARTADGQFAFKLGGRLHADGTLHIGDTPGDTPTTNRGVTDGTEVRRGRLSAEIQAYEDWHWMGEVDFADNNTAIKDFFLSYEGLEGVKLTVGHQKQPYSLAIEMSSNDIPFTERSIDYDAIVPIVDRAIGVRADANGEHWFLAAGFYGDSVEPGDRNTAEGFGTAARFIFSPIISPERVLHLGFRGAYRKPEVGNEGLQFRDETTHMSDYRILSTGTIQDIDDVVLFGPEAAFACGPFSIFGEYNRQVIMRDRGNTLQFEGGHIGATWTLTGESRAAAYRIDSGEFKRLTPKQNFSLKNGGIGAWELAGRYAYQNLNDGSASDPSSIEGGREQVLTFALNWYVNPVVRFMLNYNYVLQADSSGTNAVVAKEGEGLNSFTMRAQVTF